MDVRIGVTYAPRELEVELPDDADSADIKAQVEAALGDGTGMLWFTDRRGRQIGVPADKVAYVEVGSPQDGRRIGFAGI